MSGDNMDFRISGVGSALEAPQIAVVEGEMVDALQAALRMLAEHPECEEVEIFNKRRFVRDISRARGDRAHHA